MAGETVFFSLSGQAQFFGVYCPKSASPNILHYTLHNLSKNQQNEQDFL